MSSLDDEVLGRSLCHMVLQKRHDGRHLHLTRFSACAKLGMLCPLCRTRRPRRSCPALGQTICAVCCGTKRLVEIACPQTCAFLTSAKAHPPAVVRRQQERDLALLVPAVDGLTESQMQLLWLVLSVLARPRADAFVPTTDADVGDAVAATPRHA